MSAALQLPLVWGASNPQTAWRDRPRRSENHVRRQSRRETGRKARRLRPPVSLAFYRKHTESILSRYLYASMQVGRAPSILGDPVCPGLGFQPPVRTFEDAVIFVLDVEKCLSRLGSLDREMLSRIVLQEYTQAEAANLLGMSVRTISYKFPKALDRLTEKLLAAGLLVLPD